MQRLGKNLGSYQGDTMEIRTVLQEIEAAAVTHGWRGEVFHEANGFHWRALHRAASRAANSAMVRRIYISAGIHGDEPAGPQAVLQLIRENCWPATAEVILVPCLNPVGFLSNRRENGDGIDLNRDYFHPQSPEINAQVAWLEKQTRFDLCLCLHEDWESHGFYLYELNPEHQPSLAEAIVAGVAEVCPIDRSEIIEGRTASEGIIRPNLDPRTRVLWPESFWLLQHKTRLSYTLEAPSDFPLEVRVKALVAGVNAALACALLNVDRP
jgi:protein MpaA